MRANWRDWLALAWALAFLVPYAAMVIDQRGGRLKALWDSVRVQARAEAAVAPK